MICELPIEIVDDENIVRLIRTPSHVKNDKLKPSAFRSQAGTDDVSVIRQTHMGTNFCKSKAKEIMGQNYIGLAVVVAGNIRSTGSNVIDTRDEFCGHASILHGVTLPIEEPPGSELNEFITERCREIIKHTTYFADPDAANAEWTGAEF